MYNGIGLDTARGSGTNGYVQRNLSFIKHTKDRIDFKSEEELKKIDSQLMRSPNLEILYHDNKRKIELKCLEMEELMEEQGYSNEDIEKKVSTFRKMLREKLENSSGKLEFDDQGRLVAKATHQISEANQLLNEQLRLAFGISEYFKEGSSLDPDRKAKEKASEDLAFAQKKYSLMKDDDDDDDDDSSASSSEEEDDVEIHTSDLQTSDSEEDRNFAMKRRNVAEFSKEPNNLKNKNSPRYSSSAQKKSIGVEPITDRKGVVRITKHNKKILNPDQLSRRTELKENAQRTIRSVERTIKDKKYRKDLKMAVVSQKSKAGRY